MFYRAEDRAEYQVCMTFGSILCGMGGENKFMYTTTDQTFLHLLCFQLVFSYAVHSVLNEGI